MSCVVVGPGHPDILGYAAATICSIEDRRGVNCLSTFVVLIVIDVLLVVVAATATVFAYQLSLLCSLTNEPLSMVILNLSVVHGIRSRYAFPLR